MFSEAVPLWVFKSRKIRLRCKGLKYSTKGVGLAPSDLIFRPWAVFYVYDLYKSFHPADFRPPVIHNHLKPFTRRQNYRLVQIETNCRRHLRVDSKLKMRAI